MAVDPDVLTITDGLEARLAALDTYGVSPGESIQAAHDALPDIGGVIELGTGEWVEDVTITKHGVTLRGAGYDANYIAKYGSVIRGTVTAEGRFTTLSQINVDAHGADHAVVLAQPGWESKVLHVGIKGGAVASLQVAQNRCNIVGGNFRSLLGLAVHVVAADSMFSNIRAPGGMLIQGASAQVENSHIYAPYGPHSLIIDASHVTVDNTILDHSQEATLLIRASSSHRVFNSVRGLLVHSNSPRSGAAIQFEPSASWLIKHTTLDNINISSGQHAWDYAVSLGDLPDRVRGLTVRNSQFRRCLEPWDVEPFDHSGNVIYRDKWGNRPEKVET